MEWKVLVQIILLLLTFSCNFLVINGLLNNLQENGAFQSLSQGITQEGSKFHSKTSPKEYLDPSPKSKQTNYVDKEEIPKIYMDLAAKYLRKLNNQNNSTWSRCDKDTYRVLHDLTQGQIYALRFFDSYAKPPPGILMAEIDWIGSYAECKSKVVVGDAYFAGNYCKLTISIPQLNATLQGKMATVGICVPTSCNENQTKTFIDFEMALLRFLIPKVSAHEVVCDKVTEWKTSTYIAIAVASFLIALSLIGTLCDVIKAHKPSKSDITQSVTWTNNDDDDDDERLINTDDLTNHQVVEKSTFCDKILKVAVCFSWISNGKMILSSKSSDRLKVLHGIRFLSMAWIILGHTLVFAMRFFDGATFSAVQLTASSKNLRTPLKNANKMAGLQIVTNFSFQGVVNATVALDSFFFINGLLVSYATLNELRKRDGRLNWIIFCVKRYLRVTAPYMFVMLIYVGLFPLFVNGPNTIVDSKNGLVDEGACPKYWWTNLLYVNNFVPADLTKGCFSWGWYLACEMQFYLLSPIFIYLLYRYFYAGMAVTSGLIIVSLGLTAGMANKYDASATTAGLYSEIGMTGVPVVGFPRSKEIIEIYIRPYYRFAPYLLGIMVGCVFHRRRSQFKLKWFVNIIGWCAALSMNLAITYGLYKFNHMLINPPQWVSSFYVSTNRFAWSLTVAWMTFACVYGYGGPINAVLSWNAWAPLSRLTYCAYLVHPIITYIIYLNLRAPVHNDISILSFFLGHLVLTYLSAFVISLLVESPLKRIQKMTSQKRNNTAETVINDD